MSHKAVNLRPPVKFRIYCTPLSTALSRVLLLDRPLSSTPPPSIELDFAICTLNRHAGRRQSKFAALDAFPSAPPVLNHTSRSQKGCRPRRRRSSPGEETRLTA